MSDISLGRKRRRTLISLALFLLTSAVLTDALFSLPDGLADLIAALLLALLTWALLATRADDTDSEPGRQPSNAAIGASASSPAGAFAARIAPPAGLVLVAAAAIRLTDGAAQLLVLGLFLLAIDIIARRDGGPNADVPAMELTVLLFAVLLLLEVYVPHVSFALSRAAEVLSAAASALVPGTVSLGAGYLGLRLAVLFLLHLFGLALLAEGRSAFPKALGAGLVIVVACIAYAAAWWWVSASGLTRYTHLIEPFAGKYDYRLLLFLLLVAILSLYRLSLTLTEPPPRSDRRLPWRAAVAAGLVAASAFVLTIDWPGSDANRTVVFLDTGEMATDLPTWGPYGLEHAGRFGLLPSYLGNRGYETRIVQEITGDTLEGAGTLVLINLQEVLTEGEKKAVWRHVGAGGSLLLLGDHTGQEVIRDPSNDLLQPVGISFNFDSAIPWREAWLDGYEPRPHPLTRGIEGERVVINIGASLAVSPPARPVIVGRDGFSDEGDLSNVADGYLGDMAFGAGERAGNIVLVAEAAYGRGTVLVFGDTTPFQNPVIPYGYDFLDTLFAWLAAGDRSAARTGVTLAAALLLLAGAALAAVDVSRGGSLAVAASTAALAAALLAAGTVDSARLEVPREYYAPYAAIDVGHFGAGRLDNSGDSLSGLFVNLLRSGYTPFAVGERSGIDAGQAEVMVLTAPMAPLTAAEIDDLEAFVQSGRLLIVTAGLDRPFGAAGLLQRFGIGLRNMPLGRVNTRWEGRPLNLWNAWPVSYDSPAGVQVLATAWDQPVAVYKAHGDGGVIVVGDAAFLLSRNLEDAFRYDEGNILFLRQILREFAPRGESDG